ncbi:chemotaxis protein CheB [Mycolicibacterium duvalii]|uniref:protein-glutamate methylesterase n=1 Tax=Mycolicibacterium duvalii TaxID=39688 RepID=A0A7I7JXC2_9MYCO|nr:chemotaxis protein CheB [Mycolicibacterium duvalii]MCV7370314.1 chemotaxis protein CheB [Mycolicibacterium duvalii]PEG37283.1 chemotaxis protein CheB [Mycolicibacterium duvalii]BBX16510.1 chemotaxis protein CheB [Mycolicibacterium duvalii]
MRAFVNSDSEQQAEGVVAIGGSAGGVEALSKIAAGLPADLPYAVLMALHLSAGGPSVLAQIIERRGPLRAVSAQQGAVMQAEHIYVAVPGRHLLSCDHRIVLSDGPSENGHRPALNAMFRSVALAFGPAAIGVLLSGVLDDGVLGLAAVRARGGVTLCQTPSDALFPDMPAHAIQAGVVDQTATAADLGPLIGKLCKRHRDCDVPRPPDGYMELENRIAMADRFSTGISGESLGPPSGFTCPDCNGSLHALGDGRFRCQVGHAWTADSLLSERDEEVQRALWIAVRILHEKSRLVHQLAVKATSAAVRDRYLALAEEADKAQSVLRERLAPSTPRPTPRDV